MCRRGLPFGLLLVVALPVAAAPAEPNFTIMLLNGSEVKADRAWVQGDLVIYERYGTTASVRMVDVKTLMDRELEEKAGACLAGVRDAQANIRATREAAKELRGESGSALERSTISRAESTLIRQQEDTARFGCAPALEKLERNNRMFDEAREKAKR